MVVKFRHLHPLVQWLGILLTLYLELVRLGPVLLKAAPSDDGGRLAGVGLAAGGQADGPHLHRFYRVGSCYSISQNLHQMMSLEQNSTHPRLKFHI